jgi:hypoxanthine phosphoribosyltransferase
MPELTSVLKEEEIQSKVSEIAQRISADYGDRELVLIGVLKGAFILLSDLIRKITIPVSVDFVGTSSYGSNSSSTGNICLTKEVSLDLENKDVLIVEDIVDTGLTLVYLTDYIKSLGPLSVKVCTLIDKPERREAQVSIDYPCFLVEQGFLVGYGLDYNEKYRGLRDIYHLKF